MKLDYPELSIGANLVLEHIEELKEENLEEEVENNPRLDVTKLDEILEGIGSRANLEK